ncbi:ferric iron uptake transcriptional regulator [Brackiella oedipodis]|uniref:ferric iron uptake transcriptional regulator n=1 Tax=Brackiella oedipodis TaxID=124225 RepID=UPI000491D11D|nr:ferric iron uptake transcriptional regulator [Brackiella oedipodis]
MADQGDLKSMGLKATYPRLKILDIFRRPKIGHLSAEDVYRLLIKENVEIGLATVYRVLTQFEEAGILTKHQFDNGKAVYEIDDGVHHDHLVCSVCGDVVEFVDSAIEQRQHEIAKNHNFSLESHALVLYGICGKCAEKNTSRS